MDQLENHPPEQDPESIIRQWKNQTSALDEDAQAPSPIGELDEDELDEVAGGARPMTVIFGCDYSYEQRPSCGQYCTITLECMCSAEE